MHKSSYCKCSLAWCQARTFLLFKIWTHPFQMREYRSNMQVLTKIKNPTIESFQCHFWVPWTICFKMSTLFCKKGVGNFEIECKTWLFLVRGCSFPIKSASGDHSLKDDSTCMFEVLTMRTLAKFHDCVRISNLVSMVTQYDRFYDNCALINRARQLHNKQTNV